MTSNRFQRSREIFERLRHLPPGERERALEASCKGDPELAEDVSSLLASHDSAPASGLTGAASVWSQALKAQIDPDSSRASGTESDAPPVHGSDTSRSSPSASTTAPTPEWIGPYRVIEVVGRGGMGTIYRVEQIDPIRRELALKLIAGGRYHPEFLRRFQFEQRALARMNHPGIARIMDAGEDEHGDPYLLMEFVQGTDLLSYCDEHELPWADRLSLFLRICDAVQHAHQKGVIHRDLKPSNILVGEDTGRTLLKVIDFGIAKALEPDPEDPRTSTQFSQVIGTIDFMSPEQAGGRNNDIDTRTDVYSLGVILYRLASGRMPYDLGGLTVGAALRTVTDSPPITLDSVDPDLRAIIQKALEKSPENRYASVAALAEDLERFRSGFPVLALQATATYQLRKLYARHRGRFLVGAAGIIMLLAFAVVMTAMYQRQRELREAARVEAELSEQTNSFLRRVLTSTELDSLGHEVTVREVLDRAAGDLESDAEYDPRLRGEAFSTLGQAYRSIGRIDESVDQFRKGLEVWSELEDPPVQEIILLNHGVAGALLDRQEPAKAVQFSAAAVTQARSSLDPGDPLLTEVLRTSGAALRLSGRLEEAEAAIREAIQTQKARGEPIPHSILTQVCLLLSEQGKYSEAVEEAEAFVSLADDDTGRLEMPILLINLARWLQFDDRMAEADSISNQIIGTMDQYFRKDDLRRAGLLAIRGSICLERGATAEADSLFRRALDHTEYFTAQLGLASVGHYTLQFEDAEENFQTLLDAMPRDAGRAVLYPHLGWSQYGRGRVDAARESFELAANLQREIHTSPHPHTGLSLQALAACLLDLGQPEEALRIAAEADREVRARLRDGHAFSLLTAHTLATCQSLVAPTSWSDSLVVAALPRVLASDKLFPACRAQRLAQTRQVMEQRGLTDPLVDEYAWIEEFRRP